MFYHFWSSAYLFLELNFHLGIILFLSEEFPLTLFVVALLTMKLFNFVCMKKFSFCFVLKTFSLAIKFLVSSCFYFS